MSDVAGTAATAAASAVAGRFCSPSMVNHARRTYAWGTMYAATHGIEFDDELLQVCALLHDVGLTEAFDSHRLPFEESGGHVAWVVGVAAGWPPARAARATDIIVRHMGADVSPDIDPESFLLQVATSWEVVGRHPGAFGEDAASAVLRRYPRLEFGPEFLARFQDQAARHPACAAAASVRNDLAGRMAANPLARRSPSPVGTSAAARAVTRPRAWRRPGEGATRRSAG